MAPPPPKKVKSKNRHTHTHKEQDLGKHQRQWVWKKGKAIQPTFAETDNEKADRPGHWEGRHRGIGGIFPPKKEGCGGGRVGDLL